MLVEILVVVAIVLVISFLAEFWWIILPIVIIGIIIFAVAYFGDKKQAEINKIEIENNEEFKSAVQEAQDILSFFRKNWREPFVHVSGYRKRYEEITSEDHERYNRDFCVYFHVKMEDVSSRDIDCLRKYREGSSEERKILEPVINGFFNIKDISEVPEKIDVDGLIWEILNGKIEEERKDSYKIEFVESYVCPCGLVGEKRDIFLEKLK